MMVFSLLFTILMPIDHFLRKPTCEPEYELVKYNGQWSPPRSVNTGQTGGGRAPWRGIQEGQFACRAIVPTVTSSGYTQFNYEYYRPIDIGGLDPSVIAEHSPELVKFFTELSPFFTDLLAIKESLGVLTPIIISYRIYRIYKSSTRTYLFKDIFKDIIKKMFDSKNNLDFEDKDVHEKVYFFTSLSSREQELILMIGRWYKDGKELSDKTILKFIKLMMDARLERLDQLLVGRDLRELPASENLEAGNSAMKSTRTRRSDARAHFSNGQNDGYLAPSNIVNIPTVPTRKGVYNKTTTRRLRPNITPYTPANMDPDTAYAAATARATTAEATAARAATAAATARAAANNARTAATVPT
jgi:hypothetical protein